MLKTIYKIRQVRLVIDLVRHNQRWAHHIDRARPLEKLIGKKRAKSPHHHEYIVEKLDKLLPVISKLADEESIPRILEYNSEYYSERLDLFINYHGLKAASIAAHDGVSSADSFDSVIAALRGIEGSLEHKLRLQLFACLNPIYWVAFILKLPITIFKLAGISSGINIFEHIYAAIAQIIVVVLLTLAATKLGISIPWEDVEFFSNLTRK